MAKQYEPMTEHEAIPSDVLRAAMSTYELESQFSDAPNEESVSKAIEAGILAYKERIERAIADQAWVHSQQYAAEGADDFAKALGWFSEKIRYRLPADLDAGTYKPHDDDIVEILIRGPVEVYENYCNNCGEPDGLVEWSVYDDTSRREYFFEENDSKTIKIKLLHRDV